MGARRDPRQGTRRRAAPRLRDGVPAPEDSACFHNALVLVGRRAGYDLTGSTVAAKVGIGSNQQQGYGLAVALSVSLPLVDQELAGRLVGAAHQVCPYSNATRGNIDVSIVPS
ncbi:hypothetical protein E2651_22270 [Streptomyces sp. MZ04]|nr:hypothetical protein E2651_22270 [Streptomyces sp. MZ04]